jgi:hypothetical protein
VWEEGKTIMTKLGRHNQPRRGGRVTPKATPAKRSARASSYRLGDPVMTDADANLADEITTSG